MTRAVLNNESFSPREKVARRRRMRAARPTIHQSFQIVERAALTRRYRATLSRWERAATKKRPRIFEESRIPANRLFIS
jgi:hypothetical protein